jgi:trk system potassium uptake protein TrkA
MYVPTADTVLKPNDKITVIGAPEQLLKYRGYFSADKSAESVRVVLNGATETAISVIRRLSNYRFKIRVIDPDLNKCKEIAEQFPNVTVINGSATSLRLMEEEQIGSADYFIACTKDDEENVMTCLQAKKLGVKYIELVINKTDYEQVLQNISGFLNITADASPRRVTASEIKKYITDKNFTIVGALKGGIIEFVELKVSADSQACGKTLRDINLPTGCIIAAIVSENSAKVPGATDLINADDRLIIILEKEKIKEVAKLFVR